MFKSLWSAVSLAVFAAFLGIAAPAYAIDLDGARSQGLVGERPDGLVGAVNGSAEINALVQSVNAARLANYREIAGKEGTKLDAVQAIAGAKQVQKAQDNGWYFMDSGSWKKR